MPQLLKYPTTTSTPAGTGSNGQWSNPSNIFAADGNSASTAYLLNTGGSKTALADLIATGFGYNLPSSAIIDGIQLEYKVVSAARWSEGSSFIRLMKAGVIAGSNKAGSGVANSGVWTYGGPTDLWGTTWTPADINNATFGANLNMDGLTSSPADYQMSIDYVRVTVYYHLAGSSTPADVHTREIYKVFNSAGQYLGNLPVEEPFKIVQDMNSLGSQVTIKVPQNIDTSDQPTEIYTTEDLSQNYTTEDGSQNYTTEGIIPVASTAFQGIDTLIKNGNTVQMWLYNYWYPNGKCMYVGRIRRWEGDIGSDDDISVLLYSLGYDLDNYITRGAPFSYTNDQTQFTANAYDTTFQNGDKGAGWHKYGQTFTTGASVTNIGAITIRMNGTAQVTINLYNSLNGSLIGTTTQNVSVVGDTDVQFAFPSLIPVTPNTQYFFEVSPGPGSSFYIIYANTNPYAGGGLYLSDYAGGSGGGSWGAVAGSDLYFATAAGLPSTTANFLSKDPSTGMLAPILTDYALRGGTQKWTVASIDATGLSLSYKFSVQTVYEAMQAILSLAPNGFYYYVDLGTQTVYFKNQSTTADILLTKGVNINSLKIIVSNENSVNDFLFTGGDGGTGVNLFREYLNNQSIAQFGPLLDRKTDSRVTVTATADAIGTSTIAEKSGEQNQTTIIIPHTKKLDITTLTPGKTIGFRAFGTFIDRLILQIVHREWTAESVSLTVGTLPVRQSIDIETIQRQLIAAQTQDNPSAPS